jgi:uncharacterized protein with PIN domain/molybdopterin converting factor small subunit
MYKTASLSFHAELNDFLSKKDKFQKIEHRFDNPPIVKDSIEALGVPHPEVAVIKANNKTVGFDYKVNEGDSIEIFPHLYHTDIQPIKPIKPDGKPKFILDVHLGGLARYLRMVGFDTLYNNEDWGDKYIADTGGEENRIVLSRDIGLLKRSSVIYGYYVRKKDSMKQFIEIAERYSLRSYFTPFTTCIKCNGQIASVNKNEIIHLLEEGTKNEHNEFWQCTSCQQIYWKGTHFIKMEKLIQNIKLSGNNDPN